VHVWLAAIRGERLIVCLKVIFGLALGLLLIRLATGRGLRCSFETLDSAGRQAALGLLAVAIGGLFYWFVTAPALRFGYGFLMALPLLALSLVVPVTRAARPLPAIVAWLPRVLAVLPLFLAIDAVTRLSLGTLFTDRPVVPSVEVVERQTAGGRVYYSPKTGDSCWASSRYCTPWPSPGLEFAQFGPWEMAVASP
jgi:hypothetical protein